MDTKVRKRLFLGFALAALLLAATLLFGFWYLSRTTFGAFLNRSLVIAGWAVILLVACGLAGIGLMAASLFSSRSLGIFRPFAFRMLNFVYPLALGLAKALHFDTELVSRSYVEVHNQATRVSLKEKKTDKIMVLAPHCLQSCDCPHKITIAINNCKRCGSCPIDGLITIADSFGVELAIVTGGTLARDVITKHFPDAVVAIACERDLISGIQDVMPLTVIGVLNERPFGPCHNTQVNFSEVESALRNLLGKTAINPKIQESFTDSGD